MASFKNLVSTTSAQISSGGTITGDLVINGDLQVDGGGSLSFDEIIEGTQVIDVTNTEALLVRKDGDGGDVFIVDTTNSRVGIGGTPTEALHISSSEASATPVLLLENTNANNLAPQINLYKNSASPADGDYAGQIDFEGKDSAGNRTEYGRIITEQYRVLSGAEDGIMDLKVAVDGSLANGIRIRGGTGARVGIGSGATNPISNLEINGTIDSLDGVPSGLVVRDSGTANSGLQLINNSGKFAIHADGANDRVDFYLDDATTGSSFAGSDKLLTLKYGGNVGIGTDSPSSTLHVKSTSSDGYIIAESSHATSSGILEARSVADRDSYLMFREGTSVKAQIFNDSSEDSLVLTDGANSNTVFIKSDKVGIGISPVASQKLHVKVASNVNFTTSANSSSLRLNAVNDVVDATIPLEINSTSTNFLSSVGIGTSPSANLHISNSSGAGHLILETTSASHGVTLDLRGSADRDAEIIFREGSNAKAMIFNDASNNSLSLTDGSGGLSPVLNIKSGNVGIGTASPAHKIEAVGNALLNNSSGASHHLYLGNTSYGINVIASSGDMHLTSNGSNRLTVKNGAGVEIASTLSVGTTATYGDLTVGGTGELIAGRASSGAGSFSMYESGTTRFVIESLNGSNGIAFKTPSTARMILDDNSRISLSNNDSGGTGGRDSTSSNTLFGWNAGANIDAGSVVNTFIGHASGSGSLDDAQNNVGVGAETLQALTTGDSNVVVGSYGAFGLNTASRNVIIGTDAGFAITSGNENVAVGNRALGTANTATFNVAVGGDSMFSIPTGQAVTGVVAVGLESCKGSSSTTTGIDGTVAVGRASLKNITTGAGNVALGYSSGSALTSGARNLAIGYQSLYQADVCDDSIAIGYQALGGTDAGTNHKNIAIGNYALDASLANSQHNIAIGYNALTAATGGQSNVAIGGSGAGMAITTADRIVAIGDGALGGAAQSDGNTGVGYACLYSTTGAKNTAFGYQTANTVTSGTENTVVGWDADASASGAVNQTVIGSETTGVADNSVTLGNASVTDVYMAQDSGARVHAGGLTIKTQSNHILLHDTDEGDANDYFRIEHDGGAVRIDFFDDSASSSTSNLLTVNSAGNVSVLGALSKGSGSFKIDHPLESKKDTHYLVHSFVESPQADNIYRGKATLSSGSVEINLDTVSGMSEGTFVLLNTDIQCFTSNESDWDAVKGSVSGNILTISCQNTDSTASVSWLVIGERQDDHMQETDWTDENGKVIVEPEKNN